MEVECEKPLLSEEEAGILRADLCSFLSDNGLSCLAAVAPGQPFALELLRGVLFLFADVHVDLPLHLLESDVPSGIRKTIPPSGVWRPVDVPERFPLELLTWQQLSIAGSGDTHALGTGGCGPLALRVGCQAGWKRHAPASETPARLASWVCGQEGGQRAAPVGDSTVSGARIGERRERPSLQDVAQFLSRYPDEEWIGFIMDVAKSPRPTNRSK